MSSKGIYLLLKNKEQVQIKTTIFPKVGSSFKTSDIFYYGKYNTFLESISFSKTARNVMSYLFKKLNNDIRVPLKHFDISSDTGLPVETVRYHLRNLALDMFIDSERYHKEKGIRSSKENKYTLLWHCYYSNLVKLSSIKTIDNKLSDKEITYAFNKIKDLYHDDKKDLQPVVARKEFNKIIDEATANRPAGVSVNEAALSQVQLIINYINKLKDDPVWNKNGGIFLLGFGNMIKKRPWEVSSSAKTPRSLQIDVLDSLMGG